MISLIYCILAQILVQKKYVKKPLLCEGGARGLAVVRLVIFGAADLPRGLTPRICT